MTAQKIAVVDPISAVPIRRILEGLARIHRWILVLDEQRRVIWLSDALRELPGMGDLAIGVDARNFLAKLPKPEQVFALRSGMRERVQLTGLPLELRVADGRGIPIHIDLVRIDSGNGDFLIAIATERIEAAVDGLDARLLDAVGDAVLAVDSGGFVRRANRAALKLLEVSSDE